MTDPSPPPASDATATASAVDGIAVPVPTVGPAPVVAVQPSAPGVYADNDLVYVDPDKRIVVGRVEFTKQDKPKSMPVKKDEEPAPVVGKDGEKKRRRVSYRKHYPWGTYRSMRKIYKIDGKMKDPEPNLTLDEVLPKALEQPFW